MKKIILFLFLLTLQLNAQIFPSLWKLNNSNLSPASSTWSLTGITNQTLTGWLSADSIHARKLFVTNLTTGYLPYMSASGLVNSGIYTDGTNYGIGTTTSTEKLTVTNNGSYAAVNVGNGTNYSYFGYAQSATNYTSGSLAGDAIVRGSNGVNITGGNGAAVGLRVDAGGNVGIGTTSPGATLDVNGTLTTTGAVTAASLTANNSTANTIEMLKLDHVGGFTVNSESQINFTQGTVIFGRIANYYDGSGLGLKFYTFNGSSLNTKPNVTMNSNASTSFAGAIKVGINGSFMDSIKVKTGGAADSLIINSGTGHYAIPKQPGNSSMEYYLLILVGLLPLAFRRKRIL